MPDLVLDYHRLKTPIDHPDNSIPITKLYNKVGFLGLDWVIAIPNNIPFPMYSEKGIGVKLLAAVTTEPAVTLRTTTMYLDVHIRSWIYPDPYCGGLVLRYQGGTGDTYLGGYLDIAQTTKDHMIWKWVAGTWTNIAYEAVDLSAKTWYDTIFTISGSTLKSSRDGGATFPLSVTDTSITASGYAGLRHSGAPDYPAFVPISIGAPLSHISKAIAILEVSTLGNGTYEDPLRPLMSENIVEVSSLSGLPDFLYQEAKKYQILRSKGFTDEEMRLIFGYIPQHQVDLDAITWGAFEFHPDKASTVIITITGDNPYKPGAIGRQKAKAKRVIKVPKDYNEAVSLYNQLKKDYSHWLVGKDNFAYQVLGWEELDWLQNVDFYYGEFIDHKTHYDQLKKVPDWEIRNRLNELRERISKMNVLIDERDKHLRKIDEILRRGW